MKKEDPYVPRLKDAMDSTQPFVTQDDLARFGAALLRELHALIASNDDEYLTLGRLARRFHMHSDTLARHLRKAGVRTIVPEGKGYIRYSVADAIRLLPQKFPPTHTAYL